MNHIIDRLIKETDLAIMEKEVPVGCVITKDGKIISSNHNKRVKLLDPLAHAEILCIKKAAKKIKTWNLSDCEMFVTLKPCKMCQEVIKESRIKKVFYIVDNLKNIRDNVEYIDLYQIEDCFNFKGKIVDFFKEKR